MKTLLKSIFLIVLVSAVQANVLAQVEGYYRFPNVHGSTLIFAAEGDLWKVPLSGGEAVRLTTHAEEEMYPFISPDGKTIAYSASYEGPVEVYTMPVTGGIPTRWTYESDRSLVNGWTPDGRILYDTRAFATLPDRQLVTIDTKTKEHFRVPLAQASEGSYDASGKTVYFVRPSYHGNVTKRYKGGTARQIWKYTEGAPEAVKLTTDYTGESHHPMWHEGRVYFISDRDGTMNIWSMDEQGKDLQQHTQHKGFDVRYASEYNGDIVYQLGADIWHFSAASGETAKVPITLISDFDQLREKWEDNPAQYITAVEPDPTGDRIVVTARGRVFVFPVKSGRRVEFTHKKAVRLRDATFSHDGKQIIALSDESGEFEFVRLSANGIGKEQEITNDGKVLRYAGVPSPDGQWLAYDDLAGDMYVLDLSNGKSTKVSSNDEGIRTFSWSPDSKWLAFVQSAYNTMAQIFVFNVDTGESFPVTTDRANSTSPAWSPDGKFLYFLSDRNFITLVGSPWGARQPEPYFDASEKIYILPLQAQYRSPFRPADELYSDQKNESEAINVAIDKNGIQERIEEVPVKAGNYRSLQVNKKGLYFLSSSTGVDASTDMCVVKINNDEPKIITMLEGVRRSDLTSDGKKLLIRKGSAYYMVDAGLGKIGNFNDSKINMSNWQFPIDPREDWKQIFTDAWRMERDYFYDKNMHGVDWDAMHKKYYPLVNRVTTRSELSDLIGRFVGELSALHTSVRGGDTRTDEVNIGVASLGARFSRDIKNKGFRIDYIYKADPDYPNEKSPLDDPYLDVRVGDVITDVNGRDVFSSVNPGELIRNEAGKQVRLTLLRGKEKRDIIVQPLRNGYSLRYRDWEYTRRLQVDAKTKSKVGYLHLRAMTSRDIEQWYREFYPVFDRQGLIIDVRHNRGGNIESFILEKLLRKAWMYWKSRSGKPYWNMQYAFRGHIVILVDENTASDGEAFAEGFKKLGLGTAIGTRTWGGEIWLSSVNRLSDNGLARAPMMGVYGPKGNWLVEGHGFQPDIVVDNLPHATFKGKDAQLQAAIDFLLKQIEEEPRLVPPVPAYPDKSFDNK